MSVPLTKVQLEAKDNASTYCMFCAVSSLRHIYESVTSEDLFGDVAGPGLDGMGRALRLTKE